MSEREDYLECSNRSHSQPTKSWAHYFDGQYTKERAVLYTQAAELAGLSVTNVKEGNVFSDKNLRVDKGYVGVKVYVNTPAELDLFWTTFHALEEAQKKL